MPGHQPTRTMISFGPFDANLHTQELRKHGLPLRLPSQSFQILKILVVKPGQLVTREELQEALWPSDTFVDFEHGVNAAVSRLREVLGDSADSPQLIETLPRRGYRFIGTITKQPDVPSVPVESGEIAAESSAPVPAKAGTDDRLNWLKIGVRIVVVAACVFAAVFAYLRLRPRAEQAALAPVPFTALPGLELYPTFSPDGSQIAFAWNGDPSSGSKGFDLYAKGIGGESLLRLTSHPSEWLYPSWSPDGAQIAFHRISGADTGVYVVPALGGPERKLRSTRVPHGPSGLMISWSKDSKWIAFVDAPAPFAEQKLFLLSVESLQSKPVSPDSQCLYEGMPAFSHNGAQLDYVCLLASGELSLYNIATSDGHPRPITTFSGWPQGIAWAALDRKLVFSISRFGLGEELIEFTPADSSIRSLPFGRQASWPTISADGSNLAYTSSSNTINIWRKDLLHPESASVKLISSTREQADPRYSPDGTLVAFMSTRAGVGEIWISDTSGGRVTQLSKFGNRFSGAPRWSPDSKRIVFDSWLLYHSAVYVMDISEGVPRKLVTSIAEMMEPSWSNDGKWIYFVSGAGDGQRVYRCPISGGDAVRLSVARGLRPQESADGETLYFAAEEHGSPIKMIHLKQPGSESELEGMPPLSNESLWTVAPGGIYFVPMSASDSISYFDFKTKQTRTVLALDKRFFRGLSVSPDGRWILYSQLDEENSDIMLVDHFD